MRRLIAALALIAVVAIAPACRTKRKAHPRVIEDDGQIASVVNVADPRAAVQLIHGFYTVEANAWRWTMKNFTVSLRPPVGSAQNGATIELKFSIPDLIRAKFSTIAIDCRVNGTDLGPETYSKAGDNVYTRDVPASALQGGSVNFDFSVDKALPPSDKDDRELAIVVSIIGLTPK
jgi:hypothetical protein